MTKVKDIVYKRYTIEEGKAAFTAFETAMKSAKSAEDILRAREAWLAEMRHYSTAASLSNCRFTLNTRDEFYQSEVEYYDEKNPEFSELLTAYASLMLDTPFRSELEKKLNPRIFKSFEVQRKAFSPLVTEECKKENALTTEYSKFMSEMKFEYDGKELPLSVLRGYLSHADRNVRRAAAEAIGKGLEKNAETLDRIYDDLVKIRTDIAHKLGYRDFVELGYYRMGRIDYDREMVAHFRENVARDLVPAVKAIKDRVTKDLDLGQMMFYDNETYTNGASPDPILDEKGIFAAAQKMYDDMSPVTGAFMREMQEAEAFDVESRDGKWGGGYCTEFADWKQPFILANFNGTSSDLDVITHEFGHALAAHFMFEEGDQELNVGGMETAECHSMSMEFFAEKYMEMFCGDGADAYRLKHMLDSFCFIPYGVIVDEFQHVIYEHPDYTPEDRKRVYRDLEKKYRPYLSYAGIPYLEEGTRWQYQMHIYESPFYYIDYCLAQTVAFGFFLKSRKDYKGAFADYLNFVRQGGQKAFPTLVEEAGIASPFKDGSLCDLAREVARIADELFDKVEKAES